MTEIEIEKDIPLTDKRGGGSGRVYPWLDMKVGDSFAIPQGKASSARTSLGKTLESGHLEGAVFTSRSVDDGMVRFWRIE